MGPYRLDLTVSVLRRLSTNVVDVFTAEGHYLRALDGTSGPAVVCVEQTDPRTLTVSIEGDADDQGGTLALVRRMLGADRDVTHFERAAATVPWLSPLALGMHGVKPPRYSTLWEAFVNVVAFQQLSLQAAIAIVRRLIVAFGRPLESDGVQLYAFPSAEQVLAADDTVLRATGLSAGKVATLRHAGEALISGTLSEVMLEELSSAEAAALLQQIKGIGPWTATVILLRGLGRLDVFPMNDTSVARNLGLVAGPGPLDVASVLDALQPQQGMLYYHLLLARLEARGEVGRASVSGVIPTIIGNERRGSKRSRDTTLRERQPGKSGARRVPQLDGGVNMDPADRQRVRPSERLAGSEHLFDLVAAAEALRRAAAPARAGHRQVTLVHEGGMSAVLFDFEAGGRLSDHEADGLVTIQTIAGMVDVATPQTTHELPAGSLLVLEAGIVHDVVAHVPSQVLLIVHLRHD